MVRGTYVSRRSGFLDVERTIAGNADLHVIESIEVEHRRVAGAPSVTFRCACDGVFDMFEYSDHVGAVIWKALSGAGVRDFLDALEPAT